MPVDCASPEDRLQSNDTRPSINDQQRFWNDWNATHREVLVGSVSARQAECIVAWVAEAGRRDLDILEAGCGTGWMCEKLLAFGNVTGADLAAEVIERARARVPQATFLAGDFMALDLPAGRFDVIVTMEVLSHIADQPSFIGRLADLLKPGGMLMLATQNRFVLERTGNVTPRAPGQLRRWVNHRELRALLEPRFDVLELTSVFPDWGHMGVLRLINSPKLNTLAGFLVGASRLKRLKERFFLGHTLLVKARKKSSVGEAPPRAG